MFSYPADLTATWSVATDNVKRSVPVGARRMCNGSPTYSNLHEMQHRISAIFTEHFTCKYLSNPLTGARCVRRWYSHKIFSSPTPANNRRLAFEDELDQLNFVGKPVLNAWPDRI